jgi:hypothetical protein
VLLVSNPVLRPPANTKHLTSLTPILTVPYTIHSAGFFHQSLHYTNSDTRGITPLHSMTFYLKRIFSVSCTTHCSSMNQTRVNADFRTCAVWSDAVQQIVTLPWRRQTGYPKRQQYNPMSPWFHHPEIRSILAMKCNISLKYSILISGSLKIKCFSDIWHKSYAFILADIKFQH